MHILVHPFLCFFVVVVVGLKVLAILDGVVGLHQQVPDAVLFLQVQSSDAHDVVVVDNLADLPVQRAIPLVRPLLVVIDRKVVQILVKLLLVLHEVALGQYRYGRQFERNLN